MCGVLAVFSMSNTKLNLNGWSGIRTLEHRGPNNSAIQNYDLFIMGHTRLSIIDLDSGADQPYTFNNLRLTYNGEIFNYLELRDELKEAGYSFETESDTEVIIKSYDYYGPSCVEKFNGMWSIIIADVSNNNCFVSRDRFGQKPLFYHQSNEGTLYFASEIQGLVPYIKNLDPNMAAIKSFLQEGDFDCGGNTFFEGVHEFPAAHSAEFNCSKPGISSFLRYWDYPHIVSNPNTNDFMELLEDAVYLRLRTDVSYGVLLSGGIDSTIIAGMVRNIVGEKKSVSAVTYASLNADDESEYAKSIAETLKFNISVKERTSDIINYKKRLRLLVQNLGRGHSSPAIISVDQLYSQVKDSGLTVALDGQGADELLAGYKHYHLPLMMDFLRTGQWREIAYLTKDAVKEGLVGILMMTLRNFAGSSSKKIMRQIYGYERLLGSTLKSADVLRSGLFKKKETIAHNNSFLNRYLKKQHEIGLSNLLYYGDIVAMTSSVENRSPFMDHRLVEHAFSSSHTLKVREGSNKAVLRDSVYYKKFENLLNRKKVGFNSPLSDELKESMLLELSSSSLLEEKIIDQTIFSNLVSTGELKREKMERFLFRIYQLHLWWDIFVNKNIASDE